MKVTWRTCKNFYSVPWQRIGELLPVRITEEGTDRLRPRREGNHFRHQLWPFRDHGREAQSPGTCSRTRSPSQIRVTETAFRGVRPGVSPVPRRTDPHQALWQRRSRTRAWACFATYHRQDLARALERAAHYRAFSWSAEWKVILAAQGLAPGPDGNPCRPTRRWQLDEISSGSLRIYLLHGGVSVSYWKKRRSTMKQAKTTTHLRDRCLKHCVTLGNSAGRRVAGRTPAPGRRKRVSSHLNFLDLLLGRRPTRAVNAVSRGAFAGRTHFCGHQDLGRGTTGSSIPRPSTACKSKNWPRAISSSYRNNLILVGWSGIGKSHTHSRPLGQKVCVQGYRVLYLHLFRRVASPTSPLRPRRQNPSHASALLRASGSSIIDEFGFDRIERTECPPGGPSALQDHRRSPPEVLHRPGNQRRFRQMGRLHGRRPAGDGLP